MSEPRPQSSAAVARTTDTFTNQVDVPEAKGSRAKMPIFLSEFFSLHENGNVGCNWPVAGGKACCSPGFDGESVSEHFYFHHPTSQYRLWCVLCERNVDPTQLKRHLASRHSGVFTPAALAAEPHGDKGWKTIYSDCVRGVLKRKRAQEEAEKEEEELDVVGYDEANALRAEAEIEAEIEKLWHGGSEEVPSGFDEWLQRARAEKRRREEEEGSGRADDADNAPIDTLFEKVGNGRFKCRVKRTVTGEVCDTGPFVKSKVAQHFGEYHPLSVHRVRCALCDVNVSATNSLSAHLRTRHARQFPTTARGSVWRSDYAECVRERLCLEGLSARAIEKELKILWDHQKVPPQFHRWAVQ